MQGTELAPLICGQAKLNQLDPRLVAAVILQESSGEPDGPPRLEQAFFRRYVWPNRANLIGFVPTTIPLHLELIARASSWGLMQVMGQVAREIGFKNEALSDLAHPVVNITYGCLHLKRKILRGGTIEAGLQLWNGGGNKHYAGEVLARVEDGSVDTFLARLRHG